jgi:hypothetical protein
MISTQEFTARTDQRIAEALAKFDERMAANEAEVGTATALASVVPLDQVVETLVIPAALDAASIFEMFEIFADRPGILDPTQMSGRDVSRGGLQIIVELREGAKALSQCLLEIYQATVGGLERDEDGDLMPPLFETSIEGTQRILDHILGVSLDRKPQVVDL